MTFRKTRCRPLRSLPKIRWRRPQCPAQTLRCESPFPESPGPAVAHDCRAPRVRSGPRVLCFTLSNADFFDLCGLTQRLPPIPGGGLHCDRPRYRKLQFLFSFLCFCAVSRQSPGGVRAEERGAEGWAHPTASRSRPRSAVSTLLWRDVSRLQGTGDSLGAFCRCASACGSPSPAHPAFPGARRPTVLSTHLPAAVFNFGSYESVRNRGSPDRRKLRWPLRGTRHEVQSPPEKRGTPRSPPSADGPPLNAPPFSFFSFIFSFFGDRIEVDCDLA